MRGAITQYNSNGKKSIEIKSNAIKVYNYKSTNTNKIEELNLLISTKFNTVRNIHSNNIYVLNHNIDKYLDFLFV